MFFKTLNYFGFQRAERLTLQDPKGYGYQMLLNLFCRDPYKKEDMLTLEKCIDDIGNGIPSKSLICNIILLTLGVFLVY